MTKTNPEALQALENIRLRLLDLGNTNRLINFRHTKGGSLRVIDELPDQLVETLLGGQEMRFAAVPMPPPQPTRSEESSAGEKDDEAVGKPKVIYAEEWAKTLGLATEYEMPVGSMKCSEDKHADHNIQTLLYPHHLELQLGKLCKLANSAVEEMGANILYIAFGFLEWDSGKTKPNIAPLYLLPVNLTKGKLNTATRMYEYALAYSGEDIIANLSLREKLKHDFGLALPELDDSAMPEAYFEQVEKMFRPTQPDWKLRRYVTLGLFNFGKLLMYLDLDPAKWPEDANITDHPVVSKFLTGFTEEESRTEPESSEEYNIDTIENIHANYPLVDDADSSQHSAIVDVILGNNLVIEGPPGTGKSQTITNLIAAALANGKKVLFVAEKLAALEVVRERLGKAGLGEFCLEIHSHKAQKRAVLEEIDIRLKQRSNYCKPTELHADIAQYEEAKSCLNQYAQALNQTWKSTNKSLNDIFVGATRYRLELGQRATLFHQEGINGDTFSPVQQRELVGAIVSYQTVYKAVAAQLSDEVTMDKHPWRGVCKSEIQVYELEQVTQTLQEWQDTLLDLMQQNTHYGQLLGIGPELLGQTVGELQTLAHMLQKVPTLIGDEYLFLLPQLGDNTIERYRDCLNTALSIQEQQRQIAPIWQSFVTGMLPELSDLLSARNSLQCLVRSDMKCCELVERVGALTALQNALADCTPILNTIRSRLPQEVEAFFGNSIRGVLEFSNLFQVVTSLDINLWALRNPRFDNEELDPVLPALRSRILELQSLQAELGIVFNLAQLPAADVMEPLQEVVSGGGVFRWFSGKWRKAKQQVMALANSNISFDQAKEYLDQAITYQKEVTQLKEDPKLKSLLGDVFAGIDTNISDIESLRGWYVELRKQYGHGFDERSPIGDMVAQMSVELAQSFRAKAKTDLGTQLQNISDVVRDLKLDFPTFERLTQVPQQNGSTDGLGSLVGELQAIVETLSILLQDKEQTIEQVTQVVQSIVGIENRICQWEELGTVRNRLFAEIAIHLRNDSHSKLASLTSTLRLADALRQSAVSPVILTSIREHPSQATFEALQQYRGAIHNGINIHYAALQRFAGSVELDGSLWGVNDSSNLPALAQRNQRALSNVPLLQNWVAYIREQKALVQCGLAALVNSVETGDISIAQTLPAFWTGVYDVLAREVLSENPWLARFSGRSHESIQERFREYDHKIKKLQCQQISWKVDQNQIPSGVRGARAKDRTELHLLEHECGKKTRHIPIRQLLKRSGKALLELKPCFMMGPMSVAQYLEPGKFEFDLVIMDEASQIKPQDAIGAIARGKQLVVVGDPNQLPPSSFFEKLSNTESEDDALIIEECESILDAAQSICGKRRLRWHYRSQHESLIAFSNAFFYQSDLALFPSPQHRSASLGIQYTKVDDGCFNNNTNLAEAQAIALGVREHYRIHPNETIGVVSMNAKQCELIDKTIEELAKEDPIFREQYERDRGRKSDALFVKNLENVQGDERDAIFISMTYGPTEVGGRIMQRFGEINKEVGWRRLNVLFTRSKRRMHIYSSMNSGDILVGPKTKRGIRALSSFLRYCETNVLPETAINTGRPPDSDFEIAVMRELEKAGFQCVPQVGVSGFFIDISVIDPGNSERYLLGIECDGATYHSAKSARDRDRLKQDVLESRGWEICRIWSTDWFRNPVDEIKPIVRRLNRLKTPAPEDFPME